MKITREFCPGGRYTYDFSGIAAMGRARYKSTRLKKHIFFSRYPTPLLQLWFGCSNWRID